MIYFYVLTREKQCKVDKNDFFFVLTDFQIMKLGSPNFLLLTASASAACLQSRIIVHFNSFGIPHFAQNFKLF